MYKISYIKCAGSEARTRSIPAWKAGAPPVMRYLQNNVGIQYIPHPPIQFLYRISRHTKIRT